jgi:predicted transcriptional regulator
MTKTLSIRLDEDTLEKLDVMAAATERSRGWLMAHAVREYVEHEAWQVDAIERALKKLKTGQSTFTSQQAVEQWVDSWDTEGEQVPPECG